MSERKYRVIPTEFRESEAFLADLKRFAATPFPLLAELAEAAELPFATPSYARLQDIAARSGLEITELSRISAVLIFLRSRVVDVDAEPSEVLEEVRSLTAEEETGDTPSKQFRSLFKLSPEVKVEALAVRAFDFGATYVDLEIRPALLPLSIRDDRLFSGFLLNINYLDSERERCSMTFALSPGELQQMRDKMELASKQLDRVGRARVISDDGI